MKNLIYILILCFVFIGCNTSKNISNTNEETNLKQQDTVRIANDTIEYEIIIIDPGFNAWLYSTAKPKGYYSQEFLENRNSIYVIEWNSRVSSTNQRMASLFELRIDYDRNIDYGYDVNYKLYNYFIYFQIKNNIRLSSFTPRI
jgi:hypothetical protein